MWIHKFTIDWTPFIYALVRNCQHPTRSAFCLWDKWRKVSLFYNTLSIPRIFSNRKSTSEHGTNINNKQNKLREKVYKVKWLVITQWSFSISAFDIDWRGRFNVWINTIGWSSEEMHHIRTNWNDDFYLGLWLIPVVTFSTEYNKIQTRIDSRLLRKDSLSLIPGSEWVRLTLKKNQDDKQRNTSALLHVAKR